MKWPIIPVTYQHLLTTPKEDLTPEQRAGLLGLLVARESPGPLDPWIHRNQVPFFHRSVRIEFHTYKPGRGGGVVRETSHPYTHTHTHTHNRFDSVRVTSPARHETATADDMSFPGGHGGAACVSTRRDALWGQNQKGAMLVNLTGDLPISQPTTKKRGGYQNT